MFDMIQIAVVLPWEPGWAISAIFTEFSKRTLHKHAAEHFRMNKRMAHTKAYESKAIFNEYKDPTTKPYCGEMVSYHKATPELQRYLECFDQDISASKIFCSKAKNMSSYDLIKSPKKGKT